MLRTIVLFVSLAMLASCGDAPPPNDDQTPDAPTCAEPDDLTLHTSLRSFDLESTPSRFRVQDDGSIYATSSVDVVVIRDGVMTVVTDLPCPEGCSCSTDAFFVTNATFEVLQGRFCGGAFSTALYSIDRDTNELTTSGTWPIRVYWTSDTDTYLETTRVVVLGYGDQEPRIYGVIALPRDGGPAVEVHPQPLQGSIRTIAPMAGAWFAIAEESSEDIVYLFDLGSDERVDVALPAGHSLPVLLGVIDDAAYISTYIEEPNDFYAVVFRVDSDGGLHEVLRDFSSVKLFPERRLMVVARYGSIFGGTGERDELTFFAVENGELASTPGDCLVSTDFTSESVIGASDTEIFIRLTDPLLQWSLASLPRQR